MYSYTLKHAEHDVNLFNYKPFKDNTYHKMYTYKVRLINSDKLVIRSQRTVISKPWNDQQDFMEQFW